MGDIPTPAQVQRDAEQAALTELAPQVKAARDLAAAEHVALHPDLVRDKAHVRAKAILARAQRQADAILARGRQQAQGVRDEAEETIVSDHEKWVATWAAALQAGWPADKLANMGRRKPRALSKRRRKVAVATDGSVAPGRPGPSSSDAAGSDRTASAVTPSSVA